jgi:peptide/nickel transport system substrate-binding protein
MVRPVSRREFLGWSLAGGATLALAGCGPFGSTSSAGKTGSLSVGQKATITNLSPLASDGGYQWAQMMGHTLYDALVRTNADGKLVPHLATSWDITSPTVTIIKLRPGVRFKTGDAVTAKDVAYSIAARSDPKLIAQTASFPAMSPKQWVSAEVVDDLTVKVTTTERVGILTQPHPIMVIPENAFTRYNLSNADVGTGPFQLTNFTSGSRLDLKANPNYWGGEPKIKKLSFLFFTDIASEGLNLKSGQLDALYDVAPLHLKEVNTAPNKKTIAGAIYMDWWLPQLGKPPLNDINVRKALRYCFNRTLLNQASFSGAGTDTWNPFDLTPFKSGAEVTGVTYDPDKAKQMLAAAGASNITVPLLGIDTYEDSIIQAQIIEQGFQAAGIKTSFQAPPIADWVKATYSGGSWEGLFFNAGNRPFPYSNLFDYMVHPSAILSAYTPGRPPLPAVADLYNKVQAGTEAEMPDLLKQAQQSLIDDCPAYFMFGGPVSLILPDNLEGVQTNGFGDVFWEKASYS